MNTKMTVKQIRIRRDLIRIRLKFEFLRRQKTTSRPSSKKITEFAETFLKLIVVRDHRV